MKMFSKQTQLLIKEKLLFIKINWDKILIRQDQSEKFILTLIKTLPIKCLATGFVFYLKNKQHMMVKVLLKDLLINCINLLIFLSKVKLLNFLTVTWLWLIFSQDKLLCKFLIPIMKKMQLKQKKIKNLSKMG